MKVGNLIFSAPMVLALLDGRKTQTRRLVTRLREFGVVTEFGPSDTIGYDWHFRDRRALWNDLRHARLMEVLPYAVGDLLWVRENAHYGPNRVAYSADNPPLVPGERVKGWGPCKPSIHMPRWASRLTLEVTGVKVERLNDISRQDAIAEGLRLASAEIEEFFRWPPPLDAHLWLSPVEAYRFLWDHINAKRAPWESNPFVVATTFTVYKQNVDAVLAERKAA